MLQATGTITIAARHQVGAASQYEARLGTEVLDPAWIKVDDIRQEMRKLEDRVEFVQKKWDSIVAPTASRHCVSPLIWDYTVR